MAAAAKDQNSHVLVTGGTGFIGSHTVLQLLDAGHRVTVIDNLCNSSVESLRRVKKLTTCKAVDEYLKFVKVDLLDKAGMAAVCADAQKAGFPFTSCVHFAGLKAVGESCKLPLKYYRNNLTGTFNLVEVLTEVRPVVES